MNVLPAETVSQLSTVLSECLLQFPFVRLWTCAFLQRDSGVTVTVLLLLRCLKQGGAKQQMSFTQEVSETLRTRVGLHISLTVFNLRYTHTHSLLNIRCFYLYSRKIKWGHKCKNRCFAVNKKPMCVLPSLGREWGGRRCRPHTGSIRVLLHWFLWGKTLPTSCCWGQKSHTHTEQWQKILVQTEKWAKSLFCLKDETSSWSENQQKVQLWMSEKGNMH